MIIKQKAKIIKKNNVALNTTELVLKLEEAMPFIAGQYVTLSLPKLYNEPTKDFLRDFSIISEYKKEMNEISVAFRNSTSKFKELILKSEYDLEVIVEGPKGVFVLDENPKLEPVFIAGGVGISPFLSMIRDIVVNKKNIRPTVFYYNHSKETALFVEELSSYSEINFFPVYGHMTDKEIREYLSENKEKKQWYLAGPRGMVKTAREVLSGLQIEEQYILSEEFSGYE